MPSIPLPDTTQSSTETGAPGFTLLSNGHSKDVGSSNNGNKNGGSGDDGGGNNGGNRTVGLNLSQGQSRAKQSTKDPQDPQEDEQGEGEGDSGEEPSRPKKSHHCPWPNCHKTFTRSAHLARHVRSHGGERPYACPQEGCGKHFSRSDVLKEHIRIHDANKVRKRKIKPQDQASTEGGSSSTKSKKFKKNATDSGVALQTDGKLGETGDNYDDTESRGGDGYEVSRSPSVTQSTGSMPPPTIPMPVSQSQSLLLPNQGSFANGRAYPGLFAGHHRHPNNGFQHPSRHTSAHGLHQNTSMSRANFVPHNNLNGIGGHPYAAGNMVYGGPSLAQHRHRQQQLQFQQFHQQQQYHSSAGSFYIPLYDTGDEDIDMAMDFDIEMMGVGSLDPHGRMRWLPEVSPGMSPPATLQLPISGSAAAPPMSAMDRRQRMDSMASMASDIAGWSDEDMMAGGDHLHGFNVGGDPYMMHLDPQIPFSGSMEDSPYSFDESGNMFPILDHNSAALNIGDGDDFDDGFSYPQDPYYAQHQRTLQPLRQLSQPSRNFSQQHQQQRLQQQLLLQQRQRQQLQQQQQQQQLQQLPPQQQLQQQSQRLPSLHEREVSMTAISTYSSSPTMTDPVEDPMPEIPTAIPSSTHESTAGTSVVSTAANNGTTATAKASEDAVAKESITAASTATTSLVGGPSGGTQINNVFDLDELDAIEADLLFAQRDWGSAPDEYQEPPFGFFPGESPRLALTYIPPPPPPVPPPRRHLGLPRVAANRSVVTTLSMYP
ncbi:hypothetical protein EMPS_06310 [Entomortierella parvispora]|uniref:C2H2-type domain-containing protein n=1 Tax=Entomortierella parvispora TaxID=205924 RepID=A0A9P3HCQ3_9FUNG|nr:hypothetical protein EMPS_06310 [Entomortierella parvispora]